MANIFILRERSKENLYKLLYEHGYVSKTEFLKWIETLWLLNGMKNAVMDPYLIFMILPINEFDSDKFSSNSNFFLDSEHLVCREYDELFVDYDI